MPTLYTRTWNFKDSLSDAEVLEWWRWATMEVIPAIEKTNGTRSVKIYSGAGALRADISILWEMDDASVYERALTSPELRPMLARIYDGWDLKTTTQSFRREVTPELIQALRRREVKAQTLQWRKRYNRQRRESYNTATSP